MTLGLEPQAAWRATLPSQRAVWEGGCSPPESACHRPGTDAKTLTRPGSGPARRAEESPDTCSASPGSNKSSSTALKHRVTAEMCRSRTGPVSRRLTDVLSLNAGLGFLMNAENFRKTSSPALLDSL